VVVVGSGVSAAVPCADRVARRKQAAGVRRLGGLRCDDKRQLRETIEEARLQSGTVVVDFRVVAEENVYPMVPSGGDIGAMIRRPAEAKVA